MERTTVTIIGAGPAGLTAAYFLSKNNVRPLVFEGSKEVGGLAGSVTLWGKSYDIGPHIFLESSQPQAVRFWKEIGEHDLERTTLSRGMVVGNRMIHFPPRPLGLLRAMGFFLFSKAAVSALIARLSWQSSDAHAGIFFQNKYGTYFRRTVFNPFCEKYMGVSDSKVDIGFATGLTSFVKESGKTDVEADTVKLKSLLYPKDGTKVMWSRIAEKVLKVGEILFEKKLVKIITNGNRIKRLCFSDGSTEDPTFIISTLPLVIFLQLLDNCPASLLAETKKLSSRNTVLVYLRLAGAAFGYHYVTVFDHSVEAGRITNFNSWRKQGPAETDKTVLCIEYWCSSTDHNWTCPQEEIIAKAINEMEQVGIASRNKVIGSEVIRLPHTHPVLSIEHKTALDSINNYLSRFENLALAGRHATFTWDGQADNIIAGMKLAEKISSMF